MCFLQLITHLINFGFNLHSFVEMNLTVAFTEIFTDQLDRIMNQIQQFTDLLYSIFWHLDTFVLHLFKRF